MALREEVPEIDCAAALRALNELLSIPACRVLSDRAIDAAAKQASSESNQMHNANLLAAESYFDPAICTGQVEENASIIDCRDLLDGLTVQPVLNEQSGSAVRATLTRLRVNVWHGANIGESATLRRSNAVPVHFTVISERKDYARDKPTDNMIRLRGLFRTVAYLKVQSINGNPGKLTSTLTSTKNPTSKKQTASKKALMRIPAGSPPPPRSMTARQTYNAAVLGETASIFQRAGQNNKSNVHLLCNRAAHAFWNRVCQRAVQRVMLSFVGRINLNNERIVNDVAANAIHQNKSLSSQHESMSHIHTRSKRCGADANEQQHLFVDKREELEWRQKVQRQLNLERVQLNAVLDDTGWFSMRKSAQHEAKLIQLPAQNVGSPVLETLRWYATKNLIHCTPTVRSVLEVICNSRQHLIDDTPLRVERLVSRQRRQCTIVPINTRRTTCTDVKIHESSGNSQSGHCDFNVPLQTTEALENCGSPIPLRDKYSDDHCGDTRVSSLKPRKPSVENFRHGQWRHPHRDCRERQGSKNHDVAERDIT